MISKASVLVVVAMVALSSPAFAEATAESEAEAPEEGVGIIVTAQSVRGSVDTDFPPDLVLDEAAIEAYGASNITDLLTALGTQTQSTRARGGGGSPVVLLNGRRISGFAEVRDLPPEAITKVEVLPEDAALRYGFAAGQRVVNFILKDNFASISGDVEYGGPTAGGRSEMELQSTFLRISKQGRINLSAEYDRDTALSERERGLTPAGLDQSGLRTLLPSTDELLLNGVFSRGLSKTVNATLNLRYDLTNSDAVLGLPLALITNPTATPYSILEREGRNRAFRAGTTVDGSLGRWRWTVTGNYDLARTRTLTDRNVSLPAQLAAIPLDTAQSRSEVAGGIVTADGPLLQLPAGRVILSLKAGYEDRSFTSAATSAAGATVGAVNRGDFNARSSIEVPLVKRDEGLGRALGDFSLNANYARSDLSDFGVLQSHGFGFVWSPLRGLSLFGSVTTAQAAPTPQQLGDPRVITPNVAIYDYAQAASVSATLIGGGNAALLAEEQRDRSISLSFTPPKIKDLTLTATYTAKRSDNLLANFPSLTFDTERAFPDRIVRDGAGQLVSIDQRPINFLGSRDDSLRWGINFSRQFKQPPARADGVGIGFPSGAGGGQGGSGAGQGGPRPGGPSGGAGRGGGSGGGGGGGGFGMLGGGQGGRWTISLFHTLRLNDEIAIAPGLPLLDRLNGGATGGSGGTSRHTIDLDGGWFYKGAGLRLIGAWRSGSRVDGGMTAPDLLFSDLMTFNFRVFLNFDQKKKLIKDVPFLKGSRIALRINNLTNAIQTVRDTNSATPLRYQLGYVDPLGRTFEISFRKLF